MAARPFGDIHPRISASRSPRSRALHAEVAALRAHFDREQAALNMWTQNELTWMRHQIDGFHERLAELVPHHVTPPDLAVPPHAEEEVEEDCQTLKHYIDHEVEALGRYMENEFRQLKNAIEEIRYKLSTATASRAATASSPSTAPSGSSSTAAAAVLDPRLSQLG
jgi:hypothetical protein